MSKLSIKQIPALRDNYMYLLTCPETGERAIVDPSEAEPVKEALGDKGLDKIINTHHHWDHTDGNEALKETYDAQVIGSGYDAERVPCIDIQVKEGDKIKIGECEGDVLFVPGHTRGHIAFYFPDSAALFCGDTLFAGGCGKVFEGTHKQMHQSLEKLKALPGSTRVYCGHEYTEKNYTFALDQYPDDSAIKKRLEEVKDMRAKGKPTVPSLLEEEKRSNVFLRAEDAETFSALRDAKDSF